jgi:hypothetical protein
MAHRFAQAGRRDGERIAEPQSEALLGTGCGQL